MDIEWDSPDIQDELSLTDLWQTLHAQLIEFLEPAPTARVLDLPCATGRLALRWGQSVQSVVGLDPSPASVARAEQNRLRVGYGHVRFVNSALPELPFPDASFQVVTVFPLGFERSRLIDGLAEVRRVLAPGGMLGAIIPTERMTQARLEPFIQDWALPPLTAKALFEMIRRTGGGLDERAIVKHLMGVGLRKVRTMEQAEGMLLLVKAWR